MSAMLWNTPTVEDAESLVNRRLAKLATIQGEMDAYAEARLPIPADLVAEYQRRADGLARFADAWGFDIGDVAEPSNVAS